MNAKRVDFAVDLAYGVAIFVAIGLVLVAGTNVGIAFGLGVLVSYVIHIAWKMARFDPEWMTQEVAERVEETVTEEVEKTVGDTVSKEVDNVAEQVEETVSEEVAEEIEQTVSEQVGSTVKEEIEEAIDGEEGSEGESDQPAS